MLSTLSYTVSVPYDIFRLKQNDTTMSIQFRENKTGHRSLVLQELRCRPFPRDDHNKYRYFSLADCTESSNFTTITCSVACSHFVSILSSFFTFVKLIKLQCFDAVGWVQEGHPACKKLELWGAGVVICLERGADAYGPADATATHCLLLQ